MSLVANDLYRMSFFLPLLLPPLQMAVLWDVRVQDGEGKQIYGKDYADIWAINRLHFMAASGYSCDHVSRR